jgi:ubiquinone/menaquinone biosynthesis C-methylase UbiE
MDLIEKQEKKLFDNIAEKYARKDIAVSSRSARLYQLNFIVEPLIKKTEKNLGLLIDVACGIGAPAEFLKGKYQKYIGIDQATELITEAKKFNAENERTFFLSVNIKEAPGLLVEKADTILMVGALHHMTDLDEVFGVLRRMAKPGADLIALEPQRKNLFLQAMRWLRKKIDPAYSKGQRFFSKEELEGLAKANGLEEIRTEYQGFFSPPLAQVILKPQFIFAPLSEVAVKLDKFLDNRLPSFLKPLSWNIVLWAKFPKN